MTHTESEIFKQFFRMCASRLYNIHGIYLEIDRSGKKAKIKCLDITRYYKRIPLLDIMSILTKEEQEFVLLNLDVLV